jgi:hypothetical protein
MRRLVRYVAAADAALDATIADEDLDGGAEAEELRDA